MVAGSDDSHDRVEGAKARGLTELGLHLTEVLLVAFCIVEFARTIGQRSPLLGVHFDHGILTFAQFGQLFCSELAEGRASAVAGKIVMTKGLDAFDLTVEDFEVGWSAFFGLCEGEQKAQEQPEGSHDDER